MSVLLQPCLLYVQYGEYLIKCNKDSSGRIRKFFRVHENSLEWVSNHRQIENPKKVQRYSLSSVTGLSYGKTSKVLMKKYNGSLEPWRCFSLHLAHRSLDFYLPEESVRFWVLGLSRSLSLHSPLSIGLFFWRRLKLILLALFIKSTKKTSESL